MSSRNVLTIPEVAVALLEVSAAVTYEDFAKGSMRFLKSAFDFHGAEIHLRGAASPKGSFAYTLSEFPQKQGYSPEQSAMRGEVGHLKKYFAENPGIELYRGQGYLLPMGTELEKDTFFREFMVPEGWHDILGMAFWDDHGFDSCFYANRGFAQPLFSEEEVAIFQQAYPFFAGALSRIHLLNDERARRANLEDSLLDLPIATVLLRWDYGVEQANRAASRLCMAWIEGSASLRVMKIPERLEVPAEILAACRELKDLWGTQQFGLQRELKRVISHHTNPGLQANITLLRPNAVRLGAPSFLIRITEVLRRSGDPNLNRDHLMARLTPVEREMAQLLVQGLTNKEIAAEAGKSLQTVKNQMSSILAKLGLPNRATLISMMGR